MAKKDLEYNDYLDDKELEDIDLKLIDPDSDYLDDDDKPGIDFVQIFGTDGKTILPVLTDSKGRLITSPFVSFIEIVIKNIKTANDFNFTQPFDISQLTTTSFIVINQSSLNSATIQLQDSPNNIIYETDPPEFVIEPKSFKVLTPTRFIRFQRIAYRSTKNNKPAKIDIFFQAQ